MENDDTYNIGFGFYYRFLFRSPERIETSTPRTDYLAVAGITENGDYTTADNYGDRKMSILSKPWADDGMKLEFGTYSLAQESNYESFDLKFEDEYHQ